MNKDTTRPHNPTIAKRISGVRLDVVELSRVADAKNQIEIAALDALAPFELFKWFPVVDNPELVGQYLVNILGVGLGVAMLRMGADMIGVWTDVKSFSRRDRESDVITHWAHIPGTPALSDEDAQFEQFLDTPLKGAKTETISVRTIQAIWKAGKYVKRKE